MKWLTHIARVAHAVAPAIGLALLLVAPSVLLVAALWLSGALVLGR